MEDSKSSAEGDTNLYNNNSVFRSQEISKQQTQESYTNIAKLSFLCGRIFQRFYYPVELCKHLRQRYTRLVLKRR